MFIRYILLANLGKRPLANLERDLMIDRAYNWRELLVTEALHIHLTLKSQCFDRGVGVELSAAESLLSRL